MRRGGCPVNDRTHLTSVLPPDRFHGCAKIAAYKDVEKYGEGRMSIKTFHRKDTITPRFLKRHEIHTAWQQLSEQPQHQPALNPRSGLPQDGTQPQEKSLSFASA